MKMKSFYKLGYIIVFSILLSFINILVVETAGAVIVRVNAGGGNYTDGNGDLWSADYGYNTGNTFSTTDPISGTTDDVLYQTERWDSSTSPELMYSFSVPNGDYVVNLYFAEIYSGTAGVGLRVFDVNIEGQSVQNDLDIYSEVGFETALMKSYNVTVADGVLNIQLLHQTENPKICAIEIISQGNDIDPPSVPTGLSGNPVSSSQVDLTWNASTDPPGGSGLAGYKVYRNGSPIGSTTLTSYSDTDLNPDTTYAYTVSAYDNATNESSQSTPPVDVTTLSSGTTAGEVILRLNAGGGNYTDGNGNLWSADYGYNTGNTFSTTDSISGTTDDVLYQTERWDSSSSPELMYSFPVANGDYIVNLYFAEIYSGTAGVGLRVFDVNIEGQLVQNNLDIYSEVGFETALKKSYNVTVSDGEINIQLLHQTENPKICAIEIIDAAKISFVDEFASNTTGDYTATPQGGFLWDSDTQRAEVTTGTGSGLTFSRNLPELSSGVFHIEFVPTVSYSTYGTFALRLKQDANNFYEIYNTSGNGPGYIRKVVSGADVNSQSLINEYQLDPVFYNYIFINFSPSYTKIIAFGNIYIIDNDTSTIMVNSFEIELFQQDGFFDNIEYTNRPFDVHAAHGDSITRGSQDDILADGMGYPPILSVSLADTKGYGHFFVNKGVSGDTSADGLSRLPSILLENPRARYFTIQFGTNDAWAPIPSGLGSQPGEMPGSFKDNMQQMITMIRNAGKIPYLAKIPVAYTPYTYINTTIQIYNQVIDELVFENNIGVIPPDFYLFFSNNPGQISSDGLHPNGNGYISMAQLWFNALLSLLP